MSEMVFWQVTRIYQCQCGTLGQRGHLPTKTSESPLSRLWRCPEMQRHGHRVGTASQERHQGEGVESFVPLFPQSKVLGILLPHISKAPT